MSSCFGPLLPREGTAHFSAENSSILRNLSSASGALLRDLADADIASTSIIAMVDIIELVAPFMLALPIKAIVESEAISDSGLSVIDIIPIFSSWQSFTALTVESP